MRNAPLRRLVIALASVLVILAAFAAGTGMYTAALALWPLLLVWWPWLVAVVALGAWRLWWRLPKREVDRLRLTTRDPKARTDVEDNFRKIGQLLLAAAALVGAGLAYLPFQQQQRSSHDVLISNQVAKGFELLGNKDKEPLQRLGGIYALEGVMNNSEDYHQPVLEALSAFVRVETKTETGEGPPADDIQAALTVITRRKSGFKEPPLFLAKAHIPKAHLVGADLTRAYLNDTNLTSANLTHADLAGADLSGTNLTRANLTRANLTRAHLVGADLTRADLNDTNLTSANLTRADLAGADLSGAFLTVADLNDTNLTSANLTSADLARADLTRADLGGTKLTRAHLVGADLTGADLTDTNLTSANLTSADLVSANLANADLSGAFLTVADLADVQYLTQEQLDKACGTGLRGLDKLDPPLTIKPR